MHSLFIIIAINIAACIIALVPSAEIVIDRDRKGIKKIKKGGWILLVAFLSTITLSIFQYYETEKVQRRRDFIAETKRLESNKQIVDALAVYHLGYVDSLNKVVKILRGSPSKITKFISESPVTLKLDHTPVRLDSSIGIKRYFSIMMKNFKSEAYNVNVEYKILKKIDTRYLPIISDVSTGIRNLSFSEGEQFWMAVYVYSSPDAVIYFHVFGNYKSFNKTEYKIDEYCGYNISANESFILTSNQIDEVKNKFK